MARTGSGMARLSAREMDPLGHLEEILGRYEQVKPHHPPPWVGKDFEFCARWLPSQPLAEALAAAFRAEETPPFVEIVLHLFGQARGGDRAALLAMLIETSGPTLAAHFLERGGLPSLASRLHPGPLALTPRQARQVPPALVEELAAQAQMHDPAVLDRVAGFCADHPALLRGLGAATQAAALAYLARQGED